MIRRYGEAFRADKHYRRRPGIYAVLLNGPNILLTHQAKPYSEFQLPGGGIDPGEQPIAALHREVREETGWKIQIEHRIGAFRRFTYMPDYEFWAEKLCTVYLARPIYPLTAPTEQHHTALWLSAEEAVDRLGNDGDRAMLLRALGYR